MSAATLIEPTTTSTLSFGNSGTQAEELPLATESNVERPTLVIGDVHGHLTRLEGLLIQEGIIVSCPWCLGFGTVPSKTEGVHIENCNKCYGDGWCRSGLDVEVVLLGDIGHFGKGGSPTGDMLTWLYAERWADVILWGNHDRAVFEAGHAHSGLQKGQIETEHIMRRSLNSGKLRLAHSSHGWLFTHAGLHVAFEKQRVADELKTDPAKFAEWINRVNDIDSEGSPDQIAIRDAIPRKRGGWALAGGILWRDIEEKLYSGFRQVFGHSADHKKHMVRYCGREHFNRSPGTVVDPSYCIDIGGKNEHKGAADNCIAGIYLPEERIVTWHG